jgi:hypothetical protein
VHFVQDNDILHADAVPGDAGPAAAHARRLGNMLRNGVFHAMLPLPLGESR